MLTKLKALPRPSPSMGVALLALFIALGGSSYAALKVTGKTVVNSSLTGADIRNQSLGPRDIKNLSLRDFAPGKAPKDGGPGPAGPQGVKGDAGPAGPFTDTLPSGKTLRGSFAAAARNNPAGALANDSISFGLALATAPAAHFLKFSDPRTAQCPGSDAAPVAAPGHLCVYEDIGAGSRIVVSPDTGTPNEATRFGAAVIITNTGSNDASTIGSWAVTAP